VSGVAVIVDIADLQKAIAHVSRLELANGGAEQLLEEIGALGESQTRRRIEVEKTAPDGTPWQPNKEGHSILMESGRHLRDSVAFIAHGGEEVEWGEAWEFAHVHQYGATIVPKTAQRLAFTLNGKKVFAKKVTIPARPSVGISAANAEEITEHVSDFLGRLVQ
jgi:phage gpG-like protein